MADQKIGRNSRAPTNKSQKARTERNKRRNAEKAHALKMQQPASGTVDYKVYLHQKIDKAAKKLQNCFRLWDMRIARNPIQAI